MSSPWVLPAGSGSGPFDVEVSPETAPEGWAHTSLHVLTLAAGASVTMPAGPDERLVVPLTGAVRVEVGDEGFDLAGRTDVFAGATDTLYSPTATALTLVSDAGARVAVCGARTDVVRAPRLLAAADVPVEQRGAGRSSRLVRNFGTTDVLDAGALIACEVLTPGGNWSSYPAHKHDTAGPEESVLEEIYYFEVAGPHGFGFHRTTSSEAGEIDVLAEVRHGDTALVPHGWHGPCAAAPGHDLYYLNVMAGPGERAWLISDHPDQAWIRETWRDEDVDPRLESFR
ncbi:5-deoxy-glucuronate isomerase [Nocardioides mangrovicus]|uniref:5-deoxy-glucuronate isomerase n=1 Tax=Nocardioides mangrovicus TaxID=2478913 RepID=A0A3L8P3G0_9ACTN|nr:5-deoxy-glucuronate isomerase [Nocardioides mangrovicus]RLV49542.1 5-deoxy-glucuronate isomerase [Nocardioides mangrovicus]